MWQKYNTAANRGQTDPADEHSFLCEIRWPIPTVIDKGERCARLIADRRRVRGHLAPSSIRAQGPAAQRALSIASSLTHVHTTPIDPAPQSCHAKPETLLHIQENRRVTAYIIQNRGSPIFISVGRPPHSSG